MVQSLTCQHWGQLCPSSSLPLPLLKANPEVPGCCQVWAAGSSYAMSGLGWLQVNCRYVTTVSTILSSAVISRSHTGLKYTNSRLQFGLCHANRSQLQDGQHLISSKWPIRYRYHTFVSCLYLYGHHTLQGRYLPNSKWAPCNADEQALTEDAQRLKVNNVAGILRPHSAPLPFVCKDEARLNCRPLQVFSCLLRLTKGTSVTAGLCQSKCI